MPERILITGGAGFIGSHVARALLAHGRAVRAFDRLHEQVHGDGVRPECLDDDVELVVADDGSGGGDGGDGSGGHGLVGMRERISVFGGDLRAGPRSGGGYELRATLPMSDE